MPRKAKRKISPSRIRYEERNPTITCRVSKDIYERLVAAKEVEGKSFADILKIGLGEQEVQAEKVKMARKQGWAEGYKKGYADAKLRYRVIYHCVICGGAMEVTSENEKQAIEACMSEKGWGHQTCHERK
jgi:flagellar biosynthesis/type III secretory pathway protein FliH